MRFLAPAFVFSASVALLHAPIAAAAVLPAGSKVLHASVTFTMEDKGHVVAYPSDCTSKGLDLELNPQMKFYPNYDVIDTAKPRESYKFCGEATAIYAVDEVAFPKTKGPEE